MRSGAKSLKNEETHLTGRSTEHDTETVLVITRSGHVHHLDGAACQTESL